ncbi:MAG: hypothetical protein ABF705_11325, partial [Acetobacter syzygii]
HMSGGSSSEGRVGRFQAGCQVVAIWRSGIVFCHLSVFGNGVVLFLLMGDQAKARYRWGIDKAR